MQDEANGDAAADSSLVSHTTTRRVMKHFLNDTKTVSNEAVAFLSKATEHFMLHFIGEVFKGAERHAQQQQRGSASGEPLVREIKYDDVIRVVHSDPQCEFLSELLPDVKLETIHAVTRQRAQQGHYVSGSMPTNQLKKQRLR